MDRYYNSYQLNLPRLYHVDLFEILMFLLLLGLTVSPFEWVLVQAQYTSRTAFTTITALFSTAKREAVPQLARVHYWTQAFIHNEGED